LTPERRATIAALIRSARKFETCSPSDESELQAAVATSFEHLVIQFKRLVGQVLPSQLVERLKVIEVDVHDIYSVYRAKSELDALLPDIEEALGVLDVIEGRIKVQNAHPSAPKQNLTPLTTSSGTKFCPHELNRD